MINFVAIEFDNGLNNTHVLGYLRIPEAHAPKGIEIFGNLKIAKYMRVIQAIVKLDCYKINHNGPHFYSLMNMTIQETTIRMNMILSFQL